LHVELCNYRELFGDGRYTTWEHAFDGLIANGSLEHFVQCEEAAAGHADEMYAEFFDVCHRLLRSGGKLATTAIHARSVGQVNPRNLVDGPNRWPKGSLNYHAANLHRSFGGWFPEPGQLERCAEGRFRLIAAEDGTHDYYLTSEFWMSQIKRSLALNPASWPIALRTFFRQPTATWHMLRCLLWDESWTYQFRDPAPAQLWRHTWQAV
jgi:cyclopropane fatty-acyl-phospholipid synthase-like methyltransferase